MDRAMLRPKIMRYCQHVKLGPRLLFLIILTMFSLPYFYKRYESSRRSESAPAVKKSVFSVRHVPTVASTVSYSKLSAVRDVYVTEKDISRFGKTKRTIVIGIVSCGKRMNLTVVALKSAAILSKWNLHYVIVADKENSEGIKKKLLSWPSSILKRLSFEIHPITFPKGAVGNEWRNLFKPCACQRLFLPNLLKHIDSLIYIDTDVIFMHPVEELWQYFDKMNASQISALVPEHEDFATGWYNRFARHPYYEPLGVNSGVMLMNLTRMRSFGWDTYLEPILREYKFKIVWGDQDMINIIFHFHPEKLLILPCEWNYRPDHCMYSSVCKTAEQYGVKALHGNRGVYENDKQPVFKAVFTAMDRYDLSTDIGELLNSMIALMTEASGTNCGKIAPIMMKSLEAFVSQMKKLDS